MFVHPWPSPMFAFEVLVLKRNETHTRTYKQANLARLTCLFSTRLQAATLAHFSEMEKKLLAHRNCSVLLGTFHPWGDKGYSLFRLAEWKSSLKQADRWPSLTRSWSWCGNQNQNYPAQYVFELCRQATIPELPFMPFQNDLTVNLMTKVCFLRCSIWKPQIFLTTCKLSSGPMLLC